MSDTHVEPMGAEAEDLGEIAEVRSEEHTGHPSPKEYVRIALILLAFTAIEVTLWYVKEDLGGWYLPLLFTLMFSKFTLVVLWFMHLKFDDRRFARFFVMGLAGAATLFLVVLISLRVFLR